MSLNTIVPVGGPFAPKHYYSGRGSVCAKWTMARLREEVDPEVVGWPVTLWKVSL